jgi:hypothetical protein
MQLMKFISNIFYAILFFLLLSVNVNGQFYNEHSGAYIGYGSVKGNSPSQTSLGFNVFAGFSHAWLSEIGLQFGYTYARKVNYFLPENTKGRYYPYVHAVTAKAIIEQPLGGFMFIEEGLGLSAINDRTFSDVNEWDYGIIASLYLGWNLRKFSLSGFKVGFVGESALTFTSTTVSYTMLGFRVMYYY